MIVSRVRNPRSGCSVSGVRFFHSAFRSPSHAAVKPTSYAFEFWMMSHSSASGFASDDTEANRAAVVLHEQSVALESLEGEEALDHTGDSIERVRRTSAGSGMSLSPNPG